MAFDFVLQAEKDGGDTDTDTGANEDDRGGTPAPFEDVKDKTAADMLADAAAEVAPPPCPRAML